MILGSNPNRVFASFLFFSGGGPTQLSSQSPVDSSIAYADIAQSITLILRRHDVGELLTGEVWASDGAGGSPFCDMTVVEGILLP